MQRFSKYVIQALALFFICLSVSNVFAQDTDTDELIAALLAASTPEIYQSFASNDGAYTAEISSYPCTVIDEQEIAYERLDLINNETGERQLIAEQMIYCGGLGAVGLLVTRWSDNGDYLFYTDGREGSPDGLSIGWVAPIWRVTIADLTVENLGQAQFSSNRMWIVSWNSEGIRLIQVETGEIIDFALLPENLQINQVLWLPDNSGVIYIQSDAPFMSSQSAITYIDIATMEQNIILETQQ